MSEPLAKLVEYVNSVEMPKVVYEYLCQISVDLKEAANRGDLSYDLTEEDVLASFKSVYENREILGKTVTDNLSFTELSELKNALIRDAFYVHFTDEKDIETLNTFFPRYLRPIK